MELKLYTKELIVLRKTIFTILCICGFAQFLYSNPDLSTFRYYEITDSIIGTEHIPVVKVYGSSPIKEIFSFRIEPESKLNEYLMARILNITNTYCKVGYDESQKKYFFQYPDQVWNGKHYGNLEGNGFSLYEDSSTKNIVLDIYTDDIESKPPDITYELSYPYTPEEMLKFEYIISSIVGFYIEGSPSHSGIEKILENPLDPDSDVIGVRVIMYR